MSERRRLLLFAGLVVVCLVGAAAAIASAVGDGDAARGAGSPLGAAEASGKAAVVFRSLQPGASGVRGQVAVAELGAQAARPTPTALNCDRVYYGASGTGLCLSRGAGFASGYRVKVFGPDLRARHEIGVEGVPSRARLSPDGRYGSVTFFVTGHSYAEAGTFSTQTTLIDVAAGRKIADLEEFTVTHGDRQVTAVDVNFWGVTFARDSDRFYATLATGGKTYLIEGSVRERTARVIHENVECPSLSPDGTRIAYKKRVGSGTELWRLTVLDLATMRETPLAEPSSFDDQAEWLDDEHVLYGIGSEVRSVPADGSGAPERFLAQAASPAVVRW
jgi:hypothetical protein